MTDQHGPAPGRPVTVVVPFGAVPDRRFGAEVEQPTPERAQRLVAALGREVTRRAGEFRDTTFTTVYLAVGPSCLTLDQLYTILQLLYDNLRITPEEQSLEVLPGTVDEARAGILRESGFDQLTIRLGDGELPERELSMLAGVGFESVGVELNFGSGPEDWARRLDWLVGLGPARIHFRPPATDDDCEALLPALRAARERLADGWREYLLLHYCRPGHESRHLVSLWHDGCQLGLGPAALTRTATGSRRNPAKPGDYVAAAKSGRCGKPVAERPGLLAELVRLEGVAAGRLKPEAGSALAASGLLAEREGRLFLTDRGALALDRVSRLLA